MKYAAAHCLYEKKTDDIVCRTGDIIRVTCNSGSVVTGAMEKVEYVDGTMYLFFRGWNVLVSVEHIKEIEVVGEGVVKQC